MTRAPHTKSPPALEQAPEREFTKSESRINIDVDVHQALLAFDDAGYAGLPIQRELVRLFGARAPSINTVYSYMRRNKRDKSGEWTFADGTLAAIAARSVLEELVAVWRQTSGRIHHFTTREAWWVARLRAAWPEEMTPGRAYRWARRYTAAEQAEQATSGWDIHLALFMEQGTGPVDLLKAFKLKGNDE